ncbi:TPA: hypothetical protein I9081_001917 [Clostridium perfringens]|uniref:hypothetical protein n=1 Tax=Clostridium perfringens TaxID=1502 RepID=UPI000D83FA25|nr:hypothetical protein [Clostridium perfringens]EJT6151436.1 hypothetical protein [Clostridium perfringens]EJT6157120.1 hypothetical protein [Clostridium perfringens]MDG6885080.1 hypothetical protein [Clostridium perfringens]UBK56490.1 hypothetical protein KLF47_04520 [Clostridium perfringens]UBK59051.1 hypothetical protein KLF43_04445 [Clostridium perfringens]
MADFAVQMYIGEHKRDASSKVRGFIYQDLLAIEYLIESNDNSSLELYSEWAEDIYVETNESVSIIQVKYYTSSNINFKEIYNELFYQYVRLKLLDCNKNIKCKLSYYSSKLKKGVGTSEHIKNNINVVEDVEWENIDKVKILEQIYKDEKGNERTKENREKKLFEVASNEALLNEFINNIYCEDLRKENLEELRNNLKEKIYFLIKSDERAIKINEWEEEVLSEVGLAVSVVYLQESYDEARKNSRLRKRTLNELTDKLIDITNNIDSPSNITNILKYYVDECLIEYILEDDSLENIEYEEINDIRKFYENLAASTKYFFDKYLLTDLGQYALLNTISKSTSNRLNIESYMKKSYVEKNNIFLEHKVEFMSFLKNVWKVLYSLECKDFSEYIEKAVTDHIQFKFPKQDKIIIMSAIGIDNPVKDIKNIFNRYRLLDKKPKKWLVRNNKIRGIKNYSLDVKSISKELENNTAYISDEVFEIECMECIKLEGYIKDKDNCDECIFSIKCPKR